MRRAILITISAIVAVLFGFITLVILAPMPFRSVFYTGLGPMSRAREDLCSDVSFLDRQTIILLAKLESTDGNICVLIPRRQDTVFDRAQCCRAQEAAHKESLKLIETITDWGHDCIALSRLERTICKISHPYFPPASPRLGYLIVLWHDLRQNSILDKRLDAAILQHKAKIAAMIDACHGDPFGTNVLKLADVILKQAINGTVKGTTYETITKSGSEEIMTGQIDGPAKEIRDKEL